MIDDVWDAVPCWREMWGAGWVAAVETGGVDEGLGMTGRQSNVSLKMDTWCTLSLKIKGRC